MAAERNVLHERTFPRLRDYCAERGATFQAIDLRWGISEEAALDQRTMNICLGEIRRCQTISPRPNFLVLLGQRYGWMPPPPQIPTDLFGRILDTLDEDDRSTLKIWYRKDENAVPVEHVLLPRKGEFAEYTSWEPVERRLWSLLNKGVEKLSLKESERLPFCVSATHQGIAAGALIVKNPSEKVLCVFSRIDKSKGFIKRLCGRFPNMVFSVFRRIAGIPHGEKESGGYLDDEDELNKIEGLKQRLRDLLPRENIIDMTNWPEKDQKPASSYLDNLNRRIYEGLCKQIDFALESIAEPAARSDDALLYEPGVLDSEGETHREIANKHLRHFVGREKALSDIADYLGDQSDSNKLCIVEGHGGTGKSALIAEAVKGAKKEQTEAVIVYRFIGATPRSSDSRSLLRSICLELCRRYDRPEKDVPEEYKDLSAFFRDLLAQATARTILFIDGIDQLPESDQGSNLVWLPTDFSKAVSIVATVRTETTAFTILSSRQKKMIQLEGMSPMEGAELLENWLEGAGRTLRQSQRDIVMKSFEESERRPLYLRIAFEEVKSWRSWESPSEIGAKDQMIAMLFESLVEKKNHDHKLVSRALGYLAASRYGLAEDELLDLLSRDIDVYSAFFQRSRRYHLPHDLIKRAMEKLPKSGDSAVDEEKAVEWLKELENAEFEKFFNEISNRSRPVLPTVLLARLRADLERYLTERSFEGSLLLDFYHRELREVAVGKYLSIERKAENDSSSDMEIRMHKALASYFRDLAYHQEENNWKSSSRRPLRELPYHLTKGEDWGRLIGDETNPGILTDLRFIQAKCEAGQVYDLMRDYNAVLAALPEFREEKEFLAKQDKFMRRYNAELKDYAGKRYDWLKNGEAASPLEEPLYPKLPDILKDGNRPPIPEMSSARAARLRHFANFLTARLEPLQRTPEWTLQYACNFVDNGSPVSVQALEKLKENGAIYLLRSPRPAPPPFRPQCLLVLEGHMIVGSVSLCSNGTRAFSVGDSYDRSSRLWDLESGECLWKLDREIPPTVDFYSVSNFPVGTTVSPDGRRAVSWNSEGELRLMDLERGECLRKLERHSGFVNSAVVSFNGRSAFLARKDATLRLLDFENGECLMVFRGHDGVVGSVCVSPDGRRAISGSRDATVRLWDLENGECLMVFRGHDGVVGSVCVSPDGRRAISGSSDTTVRLWDLENGECLMVFRGHDGVVGSVCVSPDGRRAISGSSDTTVRLWDLESGACLTVFKGHDGFVESVILTPDGRRAISSGGGTARLWDLESGGCLRVLDDCDKISVSPNFRRLIASSRPTQQLGKTDLSLWDLESDECHHALEGHDGLITSVIVSSDGRRAVSASYDATLRLWDLEKGECQNVLRGHDDDRVTSISVSPDWKCAVSIGDDALRLWSLESGKCLKVLDDFRMPEMQASLAEWYSVSVSSDWKRAISVGGSGIRIWELQTGKCLRELNDYVYHSSEISVSSDFKRMVTGHSDGTLNIWELEGGDCPKVLKGHGGYVRCVSVSPDGRTAVTGSDDTTVRIWNIESGKCLRVLERHNERIDRVQVIDGGLRAISNCMDGLLCFWDLPRGECLRVMKGHQFLTTSPDGMYAVSEAYGSLCFWDIETGECLAVYPSLSGITDVKIAGKNNRIVCGADDGQLHSLSIMGANLSSSIN
ncbi:MAG: NACHT domain-containing protein [Synergistaceae bacterium]|nr:NACHT domain-containing protein [Synergistaceae bacterium]